MLKVISFLNSALWSWFFLPCTLSCGILLTVRSRAIQLRRLPDALLLPFSERNVSSESYSSGQAASTALASTVGTGNVIGTAQAIVMGGIGAVFWMWVAAALAMVIKYAEIYLSVLFRGSDSSGSPMRYIEKSLGKRCAAFYAMCAVCSALGMGCTVQASGCVSALMSALELNYQPYAGISLPAKAILGAVIAAAVAVILARGIDSVGKAAERLVPFMSVGFIILCIAVLAAKVDAILPALSSIVKEAFSPRAEIGGAVGACIQWGLRRGAFSNEAGLGSAALAHGSVADTTPSREALWGILEVFVDTVLICSAAALVIICSGVHIPYGSAPGAELMANAVSAVFRGKAAALFFCAALALFAFTSILGWSAYMQLSVRYLFGVDARLLCACASAAAAFLGAVLPVDNVWIAADLFNALMSVPNFIALFLLSDRVKQ